MSNFRLNLPVDIPWTLVNCSRDMMDVSFCDKQMPSPFRSSIALYTYDPKEEDIPEQYSGCGKHITYLKVSCSITGYQPTGEEKSQIIDLLTSVKGVDYAQIDYLIREYFACYGVLLNVSVHPKKELKDRLDKYPHIIDFEPKLRDFYQAASETGEILTSSVGKLTTNKSFGTADSTQSSWNAGSEVTSGVGVKDPKSGAGADVGTKTNASTGQVRTESDQSNWGITTDASRERREGQSTTTQLSQMYNLLTGYHSGTNRASFVMLPRPHILQPTDRRTFVQGLRVIEGVQDFFLIVIRDKDQPLLNVDVFLQTGHFPENINIPGPTVESDYETTDFTLHMQDSMDASDTWTIIGDGFKKVDRNKVFDVVDEANGWEADPTGGDPGKGGVEEITKNGPVTITEVDSETGQVIGSHEIPNDPESGVSDVEYGIEDGRLIVTYTLKARRKNALGSYGIATFSRAYKIFLRRKKINAPTPVADVAGLLITQRKLCTEISFQECTVGKDLTIKAKPVGPAIEDAALVGEFPFDLTPLFAIPDVNTDPRKPRGKRSDFAFKKGITRMIQQAMLSAVSSPDRYPAGTVSYLQTKHFQKRLLKVLPPAILDAPAAQVDFINAKVKATEAGTLSLRELLSEPDRALTQRFGLARRDVLRSKDPSA